MSHQLRDQHPSCVAIQRATIDFFFPMMEESNMKIKPVRFGEAMVFESCHHGSTACMCNEVSNR